MQQFVLSRIKDTISLLIVRLVEEQHAAGFLIMGSWSLACIVSVVYDTAIMPQ